MAKYGLKCSSELFKASNNLFEGHVLLGFSIGMAKLDISIIYENVTTGKCLSKKLKISKLVSLQMVEIGSKSIAVIPTDMKLLDLGATSHVYFPKNSISPIAKSYNDLLFTPCVIRLGVSIYPNDNNRQCSTLKCQGINGTSKSIKYETTVALPTPPEHTPRREP